MPTWDPNQYLQFAEQRTLPCRDLIQRVDLTAPANTIDLGCGPGNSAAVIAGRWPNAKITGLDSSEDMIAAARLSQPKHNWIVGNIPSWAQGDNQPLDLVCSNAAMQWVDDHATAFARLM